MIQVIRYAATAIAGLIAVVSAWLACRQIIEVQRLKREATCIAARLTNWKTKDGFRAEVALKPENLEERVWVGMSHDCNLYYDKKVDVYMHPADPAKSRLGGFLQFWLSPMVLLLTAVVFAVPAVWLLSLSGPGRYGGPLPGQWVGRWIWFSGAPWPRGVGDYVLSLPSHSWMIPLGIALVGIPILCYAFFYRAHLWHGRLVWGIVGLFLTVVFGGVSWDFGSYELVADERSVRESSALGWREVPWTAVRRLENESIVYQKWSTVTRSYGTDLSGPARWSLVLVDVNGKRMMTIDDNFKPSPACRELFKFVQRKTELTPVDTERRVSW